jgi:hypothetical protein
MNIELWSKPIELGLGQFGDDQTANHAIRKEEV